MPYKIKVDYPTMAAGVVVFIPGLGELKNGHTVEISDERAEEFRAYRKHWQDGEPGPTLLQAFKGNKYVTVETAKEGGKDR